MSTLRRLDSSGDTVINFDPKEAEAAATLEAKALFERVMGKGGAAFNVNSPDSTKDGNIKSFAEIGDETVLIPAIVAG